MDGKSLKRLTFALCSLFSLSLVSCRYRPHGDRREHSSITVQNEDCLSIYKKEPKYNTLKDERNVISMEYINGVYYLKVEVNDIPMKFIFDT